MTNVYRLSFKDIRNARQLKEGLLSTVPLERIKNIVRYGRQKHLLSLRTAAGSDHSVSLNLGGILKRTFEDTGMDASDALPSKRMCTTVKGTQPLPDYSLALLLLNTFDRLDQDLRVRILAVVDQQIRGDPLLLTHALSQ